MPSAVGSTSPVRPQPLKLLVFAGVPPPVHGQSVMVAALLTSLQADPRFSVFHVDPRLSSTHGEVGRWNLGKIVRTLTACVRALSLRISEGRMGLYYVPAPGKRGALYRDWVVMLLCRPFFRPLILHWHAVGLGEWLEAPSRKIERGITRRLLGRADLSIVLDSSLQTDAARLCPKQIVSVANGIEDPAGDIAPRAHAHGPLRCLFLGLCTAEKGLFELLDAVESANAGSGQPRVTLTVAGGFADTSEHNCFIARAASQPKVVQYIGSVSGEQKAQAYREADVFCFPTHYRHEGQPLTLIEALAFDLPVIATRWRAIPAMLPSDGIWLVEPGSTGALVRALQEAARRPWAAGTRRAHFLSHFTAEHHRAALTAALLSKADTSATTGTSR